MNPDNISITSMENRCFLVTKYLVQSLFLFALAALSSTAIIMDWGNLNLWTMFLVLSVAPMLNLPVHELAVLMSESFKRETITLTI